MPDIRFIAAGELETKSEFIWTDTPFNNSDAPLAGVSGAHGKVYNTAVFQLYRIAFPDTSIVGVRTRFRFTTSSDNQPFMHLHDGATQQLAVVYRSTGAVEVVRSSTVLATSATGLFNIDTWYDLEWIARISNGAGMVALNRDGAQIICLPSGVDTQQSGNSSVNRWAVGSDELGAQFDNCVVDRSGAYLGTGQVDTLMPNGAGNLTNLTPSDILQANYALVDEKPHDGDTSYVESTGDQIDTYQFEDITLSGTPMAAMLAVAPRLNPSVGDPGIRLVCRIAGENYESDTFTGLTSTYRQHRFHCWTVNPATGEPWTVETLNAAQWGVRCLATGIRITQVGLQVYMKAADSEQCLAAGVSRNYCLGINNEFV